MSHHLQVPNMASIFFYLESRVSVVQLVPNLALAMLSQVFFGSAMDNRFVQIASFSVWTYVANQILSREGRESTLFRQSLRALSVVFSIA